jgi:hypothetical protein
MLFCGGGSFETEKFAEAFEFSLPGIWRMQIMELPA